MSISEHPKLPDKPGYGKYQRTTYDLVSTSPAKLKYSFGKGPRFASVKPC